jgi:hypothetical protein
LFCWKFGVKYDLFLATSNFEITALMSCGDAKELVGRYVKGLGEIRKLRSELL